MFYRLPDEIILHIAGYLSISDPAYLYLINKVKLTGPEIEALVPKLLINNVDINNITNNDLRIRSDMLQNYLTETDRLINSCELDSLVLDIDDETINNYYRQRANHLRILSNLRLHNVEKNIRHCEDVQCDAFDKTLYIFIAAWGIIFIALLIYWSSNMQALKTCNNNSTLYCLNNRIYFDKYCQNVSLLNCTNDPSCNLMLGALHINVYDNPFEYAIPFLVMASMLICKMVSLKILRYIRSYYKRRFEYYSRLIEST